MAEAELRVVRSSRVLATHLVVNFVLYLLLYRVSLYLTGTYSSKIVANR
jgi:hypothetical protein